MSSDPPRPLTTYSVMYTPPPPLWSLSSDTNGSQTSLPVVRAHTGFLDSAAAVKGDALVRFLTVGEEGEPTVLMQEGVRVGLDTSGWQQYIQMGKFWRVSCREREERGGRERIGGEREREVVDIALCHIQKNKKIKRKPCSTPTNVQPDAMCLFAHRGVQVCTQVSRNHNFL